MEIVVTHLAVNAAIGFFVLSLCALTAVSIWGAYTLASRWH